MAKKSIFSYREVIRGQPETQLSDLREEKKKLAEARQQERKDFAIGAGALLDRFIHGEQSHEIISPENLAGIYNKLIKRIGISDKQFWVELSEYEILRDDDVMTNVSLLVFFFEGEPIFQTGDTYLDFVTTHVSEEDIVKKIRRALHYLENQLSVPREDITIYWNLDELPKVPSIMRREET